MRFLCTIYTYISFVFDHQDRFLLIVRYFSLVVASSAQARLKLVHVPLAHTHVTIVLVHALSQILGVELALRALLLLHRLLLGGDLSLVIRGRLRRGATTEQRGNAIGQSVANSGANSDTSGSRSHLAEHTGLALLNDLRLGLSRGTVLLRSRHSVSRASLLTRSGGSGSSTGARHFLLCYWCVRIKQL